VDISGRDDGHLGWSVGGRQRNADDLTDGHDDLQAGRHQRRRHDDGQHHCHCERGAATAPADAHSIADGDAQHDSKWSVHTVGLDISGRDERHLEWSGRGRQRIADGLARGFDDLHAESHQRDRDQYCHRLRDRDGASAADAERHADGDAQHD
jgi:hypothetical protein